MRIYITDKDIKEGIRHSTTSCPVARALCRKFKDSKIIVGIEEIIINNKYYKLPNKIRNFINNFDDMKDPKRINFKLDISNEI